MNGARNPYLARALIWCCVLRNAVDLKSEAIGLADTHGVGRTKLSRS